MTSVERVNVLQCLLLALIFLAHGRISDFVPGNLNLMVWHVEILFKEAHTKKWRYEHCVQVKWLTAAPAWLTQTNAHRTNISKGDTGTWQNWQPHYAAHWWVGDWTVCFSFLNKVTEIKFEMSTSSMGFMLKYVIHFWEECSQY